MKKILEKAVAASKVNGFFQKRKFLYFPNEILQKSSAIEPYIDGIQVENKYLSTSPEFFLKKTWGYLSQKHPQELKQSGGIYTITSSFRDEIISPLHSREFTMIEWYKYAENYTELKNDIDSILNLFIPDIQSIPLITFPESLQTISNESLSPKHKCRELFDTLQNLNKKLDNKISLEDTINQRSKIDKEICFLNFFSLLMDTYLIPLITKKHPFFCMHHFPSYTRGMSELTDDGWAKRIECYAHGIEIANGYSEMSNPEEVRELWINHNKIRQTLGKKEHPLDEKLIETSLSLKGVVGMAMGLERLLMSVYNVENIESFFLE